MKMINKISMGPIPETGIGLYVHIPFCVRKCAYCDFLSFPCDAQGQEAYVDALCREIIELEQVPLRTLYIGGGTPSILPEPWKSQVLAHAGHQSCQHGRAVLG